MAGRDQVRRGNPVRVVVRLAGPSVRRLLTLGGIAAAGWLLGGAGAAYADQLPVESAAATAVSPAGEATESRGTVSSEGSKGAHGAAQGPVSAIAENAEEVVSEAVSAGHEAGRYTDDPLGSDGRSLAENIGLPGHASEIETGLEEAADADTRPEPLTRVGKVVSSLVHGPEPDPAGEGSGQVARSEDGSTKHSAPSERVTRHDDVMMAASADSTAVTADLAEPHDSGDTTQSTERSTSGDSPNGSTWRGGSESAGTVSAPTWAPSPAALGHLAYRVGALRLLAERVALPGDLSFVVRDAAEDPSFAPD